MNEELAAKICADWISARPGCPAEIVGGLYGQAVKAVEALERAAYSAAQAKERALKNSKAAELAAEIMAKEEG